MIFTVLTLFLFAIIIGVATFIENDYGTETAQALIYSSTWFEIFIFIFISILIFHIIKFKLYKKNKLFVFLFHLSFIIIAIGAFITKHFGYEGIMHIRENDSSNRILLNKKFINIEVKNKNKIKKFNSELILSSMTENRFNKKINFKNDEINIKLIKYIPSGVQKIIDDPNGNTILTFMINYNDEVVNIPILKGNFFETESFIISFEANIEKLNLNKKIFYISEKDKKFQIKSSTILDRLSMNSGKNDVLYNEINNLEKRNLYRFLGNSFVLKNINFKSKLFYVSKSLKKVVGLPEVITLDISFKDNHILKDFIVHSGEVRKKYNLKMENFNISISIGAIYKYLPFSLKLTDFKLERYPGSMSPSSYSSDVELIDKVEKIHEKYKIYMNNVLNYKNFRFFQSSYDMDEKGTILSVNNDPGTLPTYIGYFLLIIGIIYNLFSKKSRFRTLLQKINK